MFVFTEKEEKLIAVVFLQIGAVVVLNLEQN